MVVMPLLSTMASVDEELEHEETLVMIDNADAKLKASVACVARVETFP